MRRLPLYLCMGKKYSIPGGKLRLQRSSGWCWELAGTPCQAGIAESTWQRGSSSRIPREKGRKVSSLYHSSDMLGTSQNMWSTSWMEQIPGTGGVQLRSTWSAADRTGQHCWRQEEDNGRTLSISGAARPQGESLPSGYCCKRLWALLLEWGPQGATTIEGRIMKALLLMRVTHSPKEAPFQDLWFNPN